MKTKQTIFWWSQFVLQTAYLWPLLDVICQHIRMAVHLIKLFDSYRRDSLFQKLVLSTSKLRNFAWILIYACHHVQAEFDLLSNSDDVCRLINGWILASPERRLTWEGMFFKSSHALAYQLPGIQKMLHFSSYSSQQNMFTILNLQRSNYLTWRG